MSDPALQGLVEDREAMCALVGRRVRYLGEQYEITDIVFVEDMMILSADSGTEMQEDSYGRAHRRVPKVQNLRFRDAHGQPTQAWEDVSFLDGPLA
ncbi:MAG: hypothetical protein COW19_06790 [Zetaproteobacteria bacterium CG12_big_fil_rev_8_21_14_0_65_55_1124]|nr:MAG: hypothetical protein AUJ58_05460 [Zetaproteobacteria bacterium CG1_02_55_237]PIS20155.1 MAG: hypothetical protein COT53_01840 [Zetaproteobacteria bacterium CG08_land_8_20_14_0_20_55_17]PIW42722.1 MAG: hypothetical protein COW19_06790 [Zetaproteobacteria bacterium CG12_big_fil_rev_8_21_14_0_65_55_1124]PIY53736.1 MAG: hypothetical protein COZ01_02915 [Zetaproteobacteria bacterium CG_4_10_14_0_8_um_filter_55_43]PIZ38802.1 MAG: hypothetical protein COY36_04900 [Zetaproteobacteria bacterium 